MIILITPLHFLRWCFLLSFFSQHKKTADSKEPAVFQISIIYVRRFHAVDILFPNLRYLQDLAEPPSHP